MEIKIGDVVYLKSGSHPMTAGKQNENGSIDCAWIHENGAFRYSFWKEELTTEKPKEVAKSKVK